MVGGGQYDVLFELIEIYNDVVKNIDGVLMIYDDMRELLDNNDGMKSIDDIRGQLENNDVMKSIDDIREWLNEVDLYVRRCVEVEIFVEIFFGVNKLGELSGLFFGSFVLKECSVECVWRIRWGQN